MAAVQATLGERDAEGLLPLRWFELAQDIVPVEKYGATAGDRNEITWAVQRGGREVPFRYLRARPGEKPGSRPTLLMFHGLGVQITTFWPMAAYLLATHDLILPDWTSFSRATGWPRGGIPLHWLTRAVMEIPRALGLESFSVVGSSLGGGMSVIAAVEEPARVEKVVLINAAVYPQKLPRKFKLSRVPILGELIMSITPGEHLAAGVAMVGYTSPVKIRPELQAAYANVMRTRENRFRLMELIRHFPADEREANRYTELARQLEHPILVVWGADERLLPADAGPRMAKDFRNVTYVEFGDLAHLPHEEAPERVGPVVARFLNG